MALAPIKSIWREPEPVEIPAEMKSLFPEMDILSELLTRRGIKSRNQALSYLYPEQYIPCSPFELPDMEIAVSEMLSAIKANQKVAIWGDFDADGQTSTAILFEALKRLSSRVIYRIPVRGKESHGISQEGIAQFISEEVSLLITCDTGVSEIEAINYALENGIRTIITDHHTLPEVLPNALAIVNPQKLPQGHPLRHLSGAGVAYKFIEALYHEGGLEDDLTHFLDLTAIGLIADLVSLTDETRYLAQMGLKTLHTTNRPGLLELLRAANIEQENINEETISYAIAPRLNSLGRLGDANPIIELLTTTSPDYAKALVIKLEQSNTERKGLTDQITSAAQSIVEQDRELRDKPIIILENTNWQPGVIGVVASHLTDVFQRPVAIISTGDALTARGSVRSVEGIDIAAALVENQQYLLRFGGHPMAAGFSIKSENLPAFKRALVQTIEKASKDHPRLIDFEIDAVLPLGEAANLSFVEKLELFRPFGPANPRFIFLSPNARIIKDIHFGKDTKKHRKLTIQTRSGTELNVLWWKGAGQYLPSETIDLLYQIRASSYKGEATIQIEYVDSKPHNELQFALAPSGISPYEIIDLREEKQPLAYIKTNLTNGSYEIFAEGIQDLETCVALKNRFEIQPAEHLVILTPPPNNAVLRSVLSKAASKKIWVFSVANEYTNNIKFINFVMKQLRSDLEKNTGWINIGKMAADTGHREDTVRKTVDFLVAKTSFEYIEDSADGIRLGNFGKPDPNAEPLFRLLDSMLAETAAYRRYFRNTEINRLFSGLENHNKK